MNTLRRFAALLIFPLLLSCASNETRDLGEQRIKVNEAATTVSRLLNDPQFPELRKYIRNAKAVLIIPNMYRAGFIVGGEYGKGVLMVKTGNVTDDTPVATAPTQGIETEDLQSGVKSNGQPETHAANIAPDTSTNRINTTGWGNPIFYRLTGGSIGLQIGGQAAEIVITIMTDKGLKSLLNNSVKLGGDISIAVGPVGKNVAAGTGINMPSADMYTFGQTAGLYGGISLTGAVLSEDGDWDMMTYGANANPNDVMLRSDSPLTEAANLRTALNQ